MHTDVERVEFIARNVGKRNFSANIEAAVTWS